jgi:solute carrier family 45 protein 1/2/4
MPATELPAARVHCSSSPVRCILASISLLGLQMVWSTEFSQAAPYLLSLGMSKSGTSLVFLAGPFAGLIVHPLVGAFSDRCASTLGRRRPFIIVGSAICVCSLVLFGYAKEFATLLVPESAVRPCMPLHRSSRCTRC